MSKTLILLFLCCTSLCSSQSSASVGVNPSIKISQDKEEVFYVESWSKKSNKIVEQKLNIKLNQGEKYKTILKSAFNKKEYIFQVVPETLPSEEKLWSVELFSDGKKPLFYLNEGGGGDSIPRENLYTLLYPVNSSNWRQTGWMGIALLAKRVYKIDQFFCIFQVKSFTLSSTSKKQLQSIELEVEFTNDYQLKK